MFKPKNDARIHIIHEDEKSRILWCISYIRCQNTNPHQNPNRRPNSFETKDYAKNLRIEMRRVHFVQRMVQLRMEKEFGRKEEQRIGIFTSIETYWKYYCNIMP